MFLSRQLEPKDDLGNLILSEICHIGVAQHCATR